MTKQEFIRKHDLSDLDFQNLKRYEEVRKSGEVNMFEYLAMMETYNENGGSKLAYWILSDNNYTEFKKVLENETTQQNQVETPEGTWSKEEQKVLEIMEHLIENVEDSYTNPNYNHGRYESFERTTNNKKDFILGRGGKFYSTRVNDDEWTLVEVFVRQYLNNGFDGFGLLNVEECFKYIMDNIDFIIEQEMISEKGWNASGYELWSNYRPEYLDLGFNFWTGI